LYQNLDCMETIRCHQHLVLDKGAGGRAGEREREREQLVVYLVGRFIFIIIFRSNWFIKCLTQYKMKSTSNIEKEINKQKRKSAYQYHSEPIFLIQSYLLFLDRFLILFERQLLHQIRQARQHGVEDIPAV
jgi:hypothetical protein